MQHHIGTVTKPAVFPGRPFHAQCSCSTAGDFATDGEAKEYLTTHFSRLGYIVTSELVDKTSAHGDKSAHATSARFVPYLKAATPVDPVVEPEKK